jgi:[acyl-carrier-protein] S-malonyltransferase
VGALKTIELKVSGAFHSPLMSSAKAGLIKAIEKAKFNEATVPVYCNFTAKRTTNPKEISGNLIQQLENPVLWEDSILSMVSDGIQEFVEVGPGKVLQGLNRRIDRNAKTGGVNKIEDLEALL